MLQGLGDVGLLLDRGPTKRRRYCAQLWSGAMPPVGGGGSILTGGTTQIVPFHVPAPQLGMVGGGVVGRGGATVVVRRGVVVGGGGGGATYGNVVVVVVGGAQVVEVVVTRRTCGAGLSAEESPLCDMAKTANPTTTISPTTTAPITMPVRLSARFTA